MPIYKYHCNGCEEEFEDYRSISEEVENGECLSCGSAEIERGEELEVECDCGCEEMEDDCGCGCC